MIWLFFVIISILYIQFILSDENKNVYIKIENEMLFTPIIVESYIYDEDLDVNQLISRSYIDSSNIGFCKSLRICKIKNNNLVMTKYSLDNEKYSLLSEYSEIAILKTNLVEYIWLSFKRKDNDFLYGNQNIYILDIDCNFKGFYDTIYHRTHFLDDKLYIFNNKTDIQNLINIDSFKYYDKEDKKYICKHTLNVNLTKSDTKIMSIDIRIKYR